MVTRHTIYMLLDCAQPKSLLLHQVPNIIWTHFSTNAEISFHI